MVIKQEYLHKIKDLGLNTYEAKLWTSLLSRGVSTAGELSDIANVPRSRTYDVLESLEKKGFIIMKLGKPIKYIAVAPTEVIDRVKKKVFEEADYQSGLLDTFKKSELLSELNTLHTQGIDMVDPTNLSGVVRGRKNLYNEYISLINNAKKSINLMTSEEGLFRKMNLLTNHLKKAKSRGVDIQILTHLSDESKKYFVSLTKHADMKLNNEIKSRFIMADNNHLLFSLVDGDKVHSNYDSGLIVKSEFFVGSFSKMFDSIWTKSENF
jgi:HTH-type transcriptional regulator, sugar sensing transcriptional regulator